MRIAKIVWILPTIFLVGCSTYSTTSKSNVPDRPSARELLNGVSRLSYSIDDTLTLNDFKRLFKDDFIAQSKNLNPKTKCYEYKVHIYPSLNKPILVGFDKNENYVYSIDISSPMPEKRDKIVWVKEYRQKLEKMVEEKQRR